MGKGLRSELASVSESRGIRESLLLAFSLWAMSDSDGVSSDTAAAEAAPDWLEKNLLERRND